MTNANLNLYLIYLPNISLTNCNDLWLSPNLCLNSDGNTVSFFRVKIIARNFYSKTVGLNVEVLSLRVTFLKGLKNFYGNIHIFFVNLKCRVKNGSAFFYKLKHSKTHAKIYVKAQ